MSLPKIRNRRIADYSSCILFWPPRAYDLIFYRVGYDSHSYLFYSPIGPFLSLERRPSWTIWSSRKQMFLWKTHFYRPRLYHLNWVAKAKQKKQNVTRIPNRKNSDPTSRLTLTDFWLKIRSINRNATRNSQQRRELPPEHKSPVCLKNETPIANGYLSASD